MNMRVKVTLDKQIIVYGTVRLQRSFHLDAALNLALIYFFSCLFL